MAFHLTSEELHIEDNHMLVGKLQNEEGEFVDASIDLNQFLGNDNGAFQWDGENFSESAAGEASFEIEGDGEIPVLRAELNNMDGEGVPADVNLAERITNDNGAFVFN